MAFHFSLDIFAKGIAEFAGQITKEKGAQVAGANSFVC